ncbi:PadR family transcriptional regulator [Nonomuraea angiospora]|uniref:PadR family transcriptional regulator n=1 Tax=Nonomuraea angiospora TaxID=46172 RepID=UPI0033E75A76
MTRTTQEVLAMLQDAASRSEAIYGLEICKTTGLGPGTVYPILTRLERIGWVRAYWAEEDARGPRRRMYEMTSEGLTGLADARRARIAGRLGWTSG